jgi:hypothetical protein
VIPGGTNAGRDGIVRGGSLFVGGTNGGAVVLPVPPGPVCGNSCGADRTGGGGVMADWVGDGIEFDVVEFDFFPPKIRENRPGLRCESPDGFEFLAGGADMLSADFSVADEFDLLPPKSPLRPSVGAAGSFAEAGRSAGLAADFSADLVVVGLSVVDFGSGDAPPGASIRVKVSPVAGSFTSVAIVPSGWRVVLRTFTFRSGWPGNFSTMVSSGREPSVAPVPEPPDAADLGAEPDFPGLSAAAVAVSTTPVSTVHAHRRHIHRSMARLRACRPEVVHDHRRLPCLSDSSACVNSPD